MTRGERTVRIAFPVPGLRTLGVIVFAAFLAIAAASWAAFQGFVDPDFPVTSGTLLLTPGATGDETNRFDIDATGLAADDTVQRTLDLATSGSIAVKNLTLQLTASPSSVLDSTAGGLQILIEKCTAAWTEGGSDPAFTSTCDGPATQSTVWGPGTVSALKALNTFTLIGSTPPNPLHLKITLTVPSAADYATYGNKSSTLSFEFGIVQRDPTSR